MDRKDERIWEIDVHAVFAKVVVDTFNRRQQQSQDVQSVWHPVHNEFDIGGEG